MLERRSALEDRLHEIDEAIHAILIRLEALERRGGEEAPAVPALRAAVAPLEAFPRERERQRGVLGFAGRTFIVLGGAFLLRALTEAGTLHPAAGAWLGLLYGGFWLVAADRTRGASAIFHGVAALVVALPLIIESAARFRFFTPMESLIALGAIAAGALGVAWHRRMPLLAAISLGGVLITAVVVAVATGHFMAGATLVIAVGIASLWIGYDTGWQWAAWPAAVVAILAVTAAAIRASADPPRDAPASALTLLAVLVVVYLGSFALKMLLHERALGLFEIAQTTAVIALGLGGAVGVARSNGFDLAFVAVPSLIAGVVTYLQAFVRVRPRRGEGAELNYYLTVAAAFVLAGIVLIVPAGARPAVLGAGALLAAAAAVRTAESIIAVHATVASLCAAVASGAVGLAARVWLRAPAEWPAPDVSIWIALAATVGCYVLLSARIRRDAHPLLVASRGALAATGIWIAAALIVRGAPWLLGAGIGPGVMAMLKTVIVSAAAVGLAWTRRTTILNDLNWLTYPALALGLLKIFVEDFSLSSPAMLVVSLVAYGVALTVASRVMRA